MLYYNGGRYVTLVSVELQLRMLRYDDECLCDNGKIYATMVSVILLLYSCVCGNCY